MAENHVLLETIELTQSAATVTFDNLPSSGYTDLKIIISARCTDTTPNKWVAGYLRFNGDSSNLTSITNAGRWSSVDSFTDGSTAYCFWLSGSDTTANSFGVTEITIPDYLSTSQNKLYSSDWAEANNDTFYQILGHSGGRWISNSAITSVTLIPQAGSIASGSTFSLYGIAALGTNPTVAPKATGGNIVANDGTYWYHAFLTSGAFTPQRSLSCDVLVVGGGGGAVLAGSGAGPDGGGGAGGLLAFTSQALTVQNYSVTVGAGGAFTTGSDSRFGSLTLVKGGGFGGNTDGQGGAGGSGGGSGGRFTSAGGAATSGQGNAGGVGAPQGSLSAGGGGGAGAAGTNAPPAGAGGAGSSAYSSWGVATSTGQNVSGTYWFAGGGGGQGWYGGSPAVGGNGGGGVAGSGSNGGGSSSGLANTGGGGGGDNMGSTGGSGIVIIRYAI